MTKQRKMTQTDIAAIRRGVRRLYRGPGVPITEVGEKFMLVPGESWEKAADSQFFNHDNISADGYDLSDTWELESVLKFSKQGDANLQIVPGFTFDLYVYEPASNVHDTGDLWGNLDAKWTGTEWVVFDPFEARRNAAQEGRPARA
jgi:hypothetical protein